MLLKKKMHCASIYQCNEIEAVRKPVDADEVIRGGFQSSWIIIDS